MLSGEVQDRHGRVAAKLYELDPEVRAMTEKILRKMNTNYEELAKMGLQAKGERFDHARVEVTGVASNDDTNVMNPELFDKQIKPSFSAVENMNSAERADYEVRKLLDPARLGDTFPDLAEYSKAAAGETTPRARLKLKAYRDAEINEIVAHSWGTELIYAAILNGEIPPPKRLIVVGVPDDDKLKWMLLAAWTGTEVHWVRADNDKVAKAGAERIASKVTTDFEARWKALCGGKVPKTRTCRPHGRLPEQLIVDEIGDLPGLTGHDRGEYYEAVKAKNIIDGGWRDLRKAETAVKVAEIELVESIVLAEALKQARILVERARAQVEIAHRDHDERLRNTYLDIAQRSCANPGSITQAELDSLAKPHDTSSMGLRDGELSGVCASGYLMLLRGATAEDLRMESSPPQMPADLNPTFPPLPKSPQMPAQIIAKTPFSSVLPGLRNHAVWACSSSDEVPIDSNLTNPNNPFSFWKEMDDKTANKLAAGLGDCEAKLFRELIRVIRNGEGHLISPGWVKETAAEYRPRPIYSTPRRRESQQSPPQSCPPCVEEGGVRSCPVGC